MAKFWNGFSRNSPVINISSGDKLWGIFVIHEQISIICKEEFSSATITHRPISSPNLKWMEIVSLCAWMLQVFPKFSLRLGHEFFWNFFIQIQLLVAIHWVFKKNRWNERLTYHTKKTTQTHTESTIQGILRVRAQLQYFYWYLLPSFQLSIQIVHLKRLKRLSSQVQPEKKNPEKKTRNFNFLGSNTIWKKKKYGNGSS